MRSGELTAKDDYATACRAPSFIGGPDLAVGQFIDDAELRVVGALDVTREHAVDAEAEANSRLAFVRVIQRPPPSPAVRAVLVV